MVHSNCAHQVTFANEQLAHFGTQSCKGSVRLENWKIIRDRTAPENINYTLQTGSCLKLSARFEVFKPVSNIDFLNRISKFHYVTLNFLSTCSKIASYLY